MLELTLLQWLWLILVGLRAVMFALDVSRGTFFDKTYGERDPDKPIGILQFRKRMAQYYFVGLIWTVWLIWRTIWTCLGSAHTSRFEYVVGYFTGEDSTGTDPFHAVLALLLFGYHMLRRFHDSLSISVFSMRQPVNIIKLAFTYIYMLGAPLSTIADTPVLMAGVSCFSLGHLTWRPFVAIPIYIWAVRFHRQCLERLARLRKNRAGHVVTSSYKMPTDEWFDLASSPHYFAEMLVYVSIGLLLGGGGTTWWLLTAFVSISQLYMGYSTHSWYLQKFPEYPKDRKMIIPYVL